MSGTLALNTLDAPGFRSSGAGVFDVTHPDFGADGSADGAAFAAALSALSGAGGGVLRIPPLPGGAAYDVDADLTWDLRSAEDGPLVIDARGAVINYSGTGTMFTASCPTQAGFAFIDKLTILGGKWTSSTGDIGFQLRDVRGAYISADTMIEGFAEKCVELFNDYAWCELNHIHAHIDAPKHAVYFNAAADNGTVNGGTQSFARTNLDGLRVFGGTAGEALIHCTDNAGVYDSSLRGISGNITNGVAAHVFRLAGNMNGTVIDNIGFEFGATGSAIFLTGTFTGAQPAWVSNIRAASPIVLLAAASTTELEDLGEHQFYGGMTVHGALNSDHFLSTPNEQTGATYTITNLDRVVVHNSATDTVWTLPNSAATRPPVGAELYLIQRSTGTITVSVGEPPRIIKADSDEDDVATLGQGDMIVMRHIATNWWTAHLVRAQRSDGINTQTGTSYTTVLADIGKLVEMNNAAANTCTIPPNSSVPAPIGARLDIAQYGAGQTTIAAGAGVTLRGTLTIAAQYDVVSLVQRATDEWYVIGGG